MRVNTGTDLQAAQMAGGVFGDGGTTTSAPGATTVTDTGKSWTTNAFAGKLVAVGGVYGVIVSNSATVLTIDQWYTPSSPGGAAASTPSGTNVAYTVLPGAAPAMFMGLSSSGSAPLATDTTLGSEFTTASSGLLKKLATFAHTTSASTYTMAATFTATSTDQGIGAQTINRIGMLNSIKGSTGILQFETALSVAATVTATGDSATITQTVTM